MIPYTVEADETTLRLGDTIRVDLEAYADAVVKQINVEKRLVELFRPYMHTSDFIYSGGVIPYIGTENYSINFGTTVTIVRESTVSEVINHETDQRRLQNAGERGRLRIKALQEALGKVVESQS